MLAIDGGIAAYIYVVPNGKLCGGQQAKHLQRLKEAVAGDGLRLSHVPQFDMFTCNALV